MRRGHWLTVLALASFILAIIALAIFSPEPAKADGLEKPLVTPVTQDDGNQPIIFSIACSTSAWTLVVSSDSITRGTMFETVPNNIVGVCLSTAATSIPCQDSTPGVELSSGTYSAFTTKDKSAWYCAGRSATGSTVTTYVKGIRERDRGDLGAIQLANH